MAVKCSACGNIASDLVWTPGNKSGQCIRCGSDQVDTIGVKGTNVDYRLMPHREIDDFDWESMKSGKIVFYKLSTAVVNGVDKVILHVPVGQIPSAMPLVHTRTELWIVDPPFKPYYFINMNDYLANKEAADKILTDTDGNNDLDSIGNVKGTDREGVIKVEFKNDEYRKKSVFKFNQRGIRLYESSVTLARRIMFDLGLSVASLPTKLYWDIEVDPREVTAPGVARCNNRIILICAKDETGKEFVFVLEAETDEAETKLLKDFLKLRFQYSADCGYNSTRFDTPYVQARCDVLGIAWSSLFTNSMDMHDMYSTMSVSQQRNEREQFDLDTVGLKEFGMGKVDFEGYDKLYEFYLHDKPKLIRYCKRDVEIVYLLDEKLSAVDTRLFLCNLTFVRPDSRLTFMEGIEAFILRRLVLRQPRMALRTRVVEKRHYESYSGAMVVDPVAGMHEWVLVLDFKSMYNRIMQSFNIGIDTLDPNGEIFTPVARFTNKFKSVDSEALDELERYRNIELAKRDRYPLYSEGWTMYDKRQYGVKKYSLTFYGVHGATDSRLYHPEVAESITLTGQECLKQAAKISESMGFKVLYGDTDSIFVKCPMCIGDLEGTLEIANKMCDTISEQVNKYIAETFHVVNPKIRIELDKVFQKLYLPGKKKRYTGWLMWRGVLVNPVFVCSKCGERTEASKLLNLPNPSVNLFLNWAKTIGRVSDVVETIGCVCPKCAGNLEKEPKLYLYVAGLESKRRDWTSYAKKLQLKLFELFLDEINRDYIKNLVNEHVRDLYLGKYDTEITFTKPIKRILSAYKAKAQHVRAAMLWEERTNKKVVISQYITYYIMDNKGTVFPLIDASEVGKVKLPRTCYDYIIKHQLNGILTRLGFTEDEIDDMFTIDEDEMRMRFDPKQQALGQFY